MELATQTQVTVSSESVNTVFSWYENVLNTFILSGIAFLWNVETKTLK